MESKSKTIINGITVPVSAAVLILFSQGFLNFGSSSPIPNVIIDDQEIFPRPRFDANFDCSGWGVHARFHITNLDDFDGFVEVGIIRKVDGFREISNLFFIEANGGIQETLSAESSYCDPEAVGVGGNAPEFEAQIVDVRGR